MKQPIIAHRRLIGLVILASITMLFGPAQAQVRSPFGPRGRPVAGDDDGAPTPPPSPLRSLTLDDEQEFSDSSNAVVAAIRETNPTTPLELSRALRAMVNLGRTDEAQRYLDQLIRANPDDATLYEIQQELGTGFLINMYRSTDLSAESNVFARRVLEAAYNEARAPNRVDQLVRALSSTSPAARAKALFELRELSESAAAPMLAVIQDPNRADEHAAIREALVELDFAAIQPMLGAIRSTDSSVRQTAMYVLGHLRERDAIEHLVWPSMNPNLDDQERMVAIEAMQRIVGFEPTLAEGNKFLSSRVRAYLDGAVPGVIDYDNQLTLWRWDPTRNESVPQRIPQHAASLLLASELAGDMYAMDSSSVEVRRLFLATQIAAFKRLSGMRQPLAAGEAYDACAAAGVAAMEDLLAWAMAEAQIPAAIGAAEVLGQIGDASLFESSDGQQRPLAQALQHSDRRVRFAATLAAVKLNPDQAYAGCSHVPENLAYFANSIGDRRVLIGHPNTTQAETLAGIFAEMGYDTDIARGSRELFKKATASPDIECVMISDVIYSPDFNELLQQLRKDPRTSKLPVALISRREALTKARRIAAGDPLTVAVPFPHEANGARLALGQAQATEGIDRIDRDERYNQAAQSLDALIQLASVNRESSVYDLRLHEERVAEALYTAGLATRAAQFLALSGSPFAQRSLVELASQTAMPLEDRQAAAAAFARSVEDRGVMLTSQEVLLQYQRYNQSEGMDRETQQVFGSILDTIEAAGRSTTSLNDDQ